MALSAASTIASSMNIQQALNQNALVSPKGSVTQGFPQQEQRSVNVPQHHLVMNPIHLPIAYPLSRKKPRIFAKMKQRSGKWTPEEERFANALIEEFEKGTIQDCENGCTLRAFLSRKLHCAPMRISKKYAGKSIGKHVFLSRNSAPHCHQHAQQSAVKLSRLEFQFHMSLVQDGSAGIGHENMKMDYEFLACNDFNPLMTRAKYQIPLQNNQMVSSGSQLSGEVSGYNMFHATNQGFSSQPTIFHWPLTPTQHAGNPTHNIRINQNCAVKMHQNIYGVFKEAQMSPQSIQTISNVEDNEHKFSVKYSEDVSTMSKNMGEMSRSINKGVRACQSCDAKKLTARKEVRKESSNVKQDQSHFVMEHPDTKMTLKRKCNDGGDMNHNFFMDNVNGTSSLESSTAVKQDPYFVGIHPKGNVSSIPLTPSNKNTESSLRKCSLDNEFEHPTSVSADTYALFAQQSAIAVSKHSAYCMNDGVLQSSGSASIVSQTPQTSENESEIFTTALSDPCLLSTEDAKSATSNPFSSMLRSGIIINNGAAFNATNLQIHLEAAEEKDWANHVTKDKTNSSCNSIKLNIDAPTSHVNLISGSEKSSDSAEGSTRLSGSGSDNSDSASDEGNSSGTVFSCHVRDGVK